MMRRFLCLYLNTGGGHKAPAKVLKQYIDMKYPDSKTFLASGISEKNKIDSFIIEKWYHFICNYIKGGWALFYIVASTGFIQRIITKILRPQTKRYIKNLIEEYKPTHIVSFHFLLTPHIVSAIRSVNPNIKITVYVTDPFSCTSAWFYEKNVTCIVASEIVKKFAIEKCGMQDENLIVLPFLINPKFYDPHNDLERAVLRKKFKINDNNRVLLITGGAGGLPDAVSIVTQLLNSSTGISIFVVCGKDAGSKVVLDSLAQLYPSIDLRVMGFVSNMDELIHLCDLAIIKPGASTIFEIFGSKRPAIISTYLFGQEKGNVHFAIANKVGWFIQNPKEIVLKVNEYFSNPSEQAIIEKKLKQLPIDKNMEVVADFIYNF